MKLKFKVILIVSGSLVLVSCGTQMGGYTETDGVYYDPNKDIIPEGIMMPDQNVIDEPYVYDKDSLSIIEQNQKNQQAQRDKYKNWSGNKNQSDWGNYAGSEQNYYYNNWGNPYYYGMSPYYGWGNRWSIGFSWGSPWYYGYNPYYWDFYWGGYYPSYYGGYYNPWYYNYYYYPYYYPYNGYYPYYHGGYYYGSPYNYKRSGTDSINRGNNGFQNNSSGNNRGFNRMTPNTNQAPTNNNNNGFRRSEFGNPSPKQNAIPNNNSAPSNRGFRRSAENYSSPQPSYSAPRNDNFRSSGSFNSGGSSSFGGNNSGGGSRSGGGGFRGGFR